MIRHTLDREPSRTFPIPTHYGQVPVHHNDVLRQRAIARRLWSLVTHRPGKFVG